MLPRLQQFLPARPWAHLLAAGLGIGLGVGEVSAQDSMHGYVEPCTPAFVAETDTECELCAPTHERPNLCEETLGRQGYQRKCRTGGHSAPGEVWCAARRSERATGGAAYTPYLLGLFAACGLFGLGWYLRRRRRGAK